ncbi:glycosyltransferase family 4 protein [Algoriphagus resistens]|uniref:glycosyltransferase family 4 protein n=1 Tax=Algoriphagus resistens TaxID=1750590 RepID=UPI001E2FF91B|nr:glycosyltransferase family 4 protein [Algoriphagus resistens]
MNVLFLHSTSDLYGSARIFLEVIKIYNSLGVKPVVVLSGEGPLAESLREINVSVKIQNLGVLRRKYNSPRGLMNRGGRILKTYVFLNSLHKQYKFALVYTNTLGVLVGAFWAKRHKLPHIWHIHEVLEGPKALVDLMVKLLDSSTPQPIAVSKSVGDFWQEKLTIARPQVIYNGIPYGDFLEVYPNPKSAFQIPAEKLVITMIGRINPGKGQLFFLELAKRLCITFPELKFVMVGDAYMGYETIGEEIAEFVMQNKLQDNVIDLGFRKDIPRVLAATDIFVLPSILPDSLPTVILEAMASGCPVVATRSGGASEMVIEDQTGFLIPINGIEQGVSALIKLILSPELRKTFGEAGRNHVLENFSLENFRENIKNHLWQQLKRN